MHYRIRNSFEIAKFQFLHLFVRMDFWIVIVTLFAFFSVVLKDVGQSLVAMGAHVSVFEVFIGLYSNPDVIFMILIGSLFLISDIPRGHAGYEIQVLRASRYAWYGAQWIYAAWTGIVYFLLLNLSALVFYLPALDIAVTSKDGVAGDILLLWLTYLFLFMLITMFFAGVCCVCNLFNFPAGIGILIDSIFIFMYFLSVTGRSFGILSPVEVYTGYTGQGAKSFLTTVIYFLILNAVLFVIGAWSAKRKDIIFETYS